MDRLTSTILIIKDYEVESTFYLFPSSILIQGSSFSEGSLINKKSIEQKIQVVGKMEFDVMATMSSGSSIKSGSILKVPIGNLKLLSLEYYIKLTCDLMGHSTDFVGLVNVILDSRVNSEKYSEDIIELRKLVDDKSKELNKIQNRFQLKINSLTVKNSKIESESIFGIDKLFLGGYDEKSVQKILEDEKHNIASLNKYLEELKSIRERLLFYGKIMAPKGIINFLTSKGSSVESANELAIALGNDVAMANICTFEKVEELINTINTDINMSLQIIDEINKLESKSSLTDIIDVLSKKLTTEQQQLVSSKILIGKDNYNLQNNSTNPLDNVVKQESLREVLQKISSSFSTSDGSNNNLNNAIHPSIIEELVSKISLLEGEVVNQNNYKLKYEELLNATLKLFENEKQLPVTSCSVDTINLINCHQKTIDEITNETKNSLNEMAGYLMISDDKLLAVTSNYNELKSKYDLLISSITQVDLVMSTSDNIAPMQCSKDVDLTCQLEKKDSEIKKLKEKLAQADESAIQMGNNFSQIGDGFLVKIDNLQNNLSDSNCKLLSLQKNLSFFETENVSLKAEMKKYDSYSSSLVLDNKNLKDKLNNLERELTKITNDAVIMSKNIQERDLTSDSKSIKILQAIRDLSVMPNFVAALDRIISLGAKQIKLLKSLNDGNITTAVYNDQSNKISCELETKKTEFIGIGIKLEALLC